MANPNAAATPTGGDLSSPPPRRWASPWKLVQRFASFKTAHRLQELADRYQSGQPLLADRFRSAARINGSRAA